MTLGDVRATRRTFLQICRKVVEGAPIDGAAFTQMTADTAARDPWVASDPTISEIELAQFTLGEGPAQDAFRERRPVLVPEFAGSAAARRWPVFVAETAHLGVGALFALPMQVGAIVAGVCDVYRRAPGPLSERDLHLLLLEIDAATLRLLVVRSGSTVYSAEAATPGGTLPRPVHQATGMLVVQLEVDVESAFARLRAHAYVQGRSIHDVADDIVERRLRLELDL